MDLTPDAALRLARTQFFDHSWFCEHSLTLRDKGGVVVPLCLTPSQSKLVQAIHSQVKRGTPVRTVCLKARQVHMSVGVASYVWKQSAFLDGQKTLVFGDLHRSAANLFSYYQQFDDAYDPQASGFRKLECTGVTKHRKIETLAPAKRIELDPRHAARLRQMQSQLHEIQARMESYLDAVITTVADPGYYRLSADCSALIGAEPPVDKR